MTEKRIDARGVACPQPVVMTKNALEEEGTTSVTVLVDDAVAVENITRFAENNGGSVAVREEDGVTVLSVTMGGAAPAVSRRRTVVFIRTMTVGRGDDQLGANLMEIFLATLRETTPPPAAIVLMNEGVKLAVTGANCIPALETLLSQGVDLLVCGTCLDHFGLKPRVAVGTVSNFFEITQRFMDADNVLTM